MKNNLSTSAITLTCVMLIGAERSHAEMFTIAMLPDTQKYSAGYPDIFSAQTNWLSKNRDKENIVFASLVGDIVEDGALGFDNNQRQWEIADHAMSILDGSARISHGSIPYAAVPGNHDYDQVGNRLNADRYVEFFGSSRFEDKSWYGGASENQLNHFQHFQMDDREFLHIGLEWEAPDEAIQWAQKILDTHPDTPAIVSTHSYLTSGGRYTSPISFGGNSGEDLYQKLVRLNPQIFMVLGGHFPGPTAHQISINDAGLPVYEILANFQHQSNGGDGWLQLLRFLPEENEILVETFSPTRNAGQGEYLRSGSSRFRFDIDFQQRFETALLPEPSSLELFIGGTLGLLMSWLLYSGINRKKVAALR